MDKNSNWTNQPPRKLQKVISHQTQQSSTHARQPADLKKIVQNYQFWLSHLISRNQSSQVYSGTDKNTQRQVAIKVIPIDKSLSQRQRYDMQNQIKLCKSLPRHKNIVSVYDTFSTANNYYIMMEKCSGDVKTLMSAKKGLNQEEVVSIMLDVLQGLRHLAMNNYVHCNIKPSNILIGNDGTAKLADFALMRRLPTTDKPPIQANQWTPYMSPLTLVTKQYDVNNDIWAMAVMLYQCLHGYHNYPWKFQNFNDLLSRVYDDKVEFHSKKVSKEMAQFLRRLLGTKNGNGLGVMEVYNDPFVKEKLGERGVVRQGTGMIDEQYQPKLFKNFTNSNTSPQKPSTQDPFMKFATQIQAHNMQAQKHYPSYPQQTKRHASNYQTSSSPRKISLKNQFTNIQQVTKRISRKQILDCQVAFMRFINIVLKQDQHGYVVEKRDNNINSLARNNGDFKLVQMQQKKQIDHQLFRFVLIKQALGQKEWLKRTLDPHMHENPFSIDGVEEFLHRNQNKEVVKSFRHVLAEYDKKYSCLQEEMERLTDVLTDKLSLIKCEWRPRDILVPSLQRKEILPILGVRLSRELCKHIWFEIANGYTTLQTQAQNSQNYRIQVIAQMEEKSRRVDFLMTYYILNCLLIDNFSSPEHFVRNSGLHVIMNNKPMKMELDDFRLVEEKLRLLEII